MTELLLKNNIKEIRILKNISGLRLAKILGTNQTKVRSAELGKVRVTIDFINKVAKALDVSPLALIMSNDDYTKEIEGRTHKIKKIRIEQGLTQKELAKMIGITEKTIQNYESLQYKIPKQNLDKIANALKVTPNELLEDMFIDYSLINMNYHKIQLINQPHSAGHGQPLVYQQKEFLYIDKDDLALTEHFKNVNISNLKVILTNGDSMEPTIKQNCYVFVDTSIKSFLDDGIYAFMLNGDYFLKRLQYLGQGKFNIISDNKLYSTYSIIINESDNFQILGKVKGSIAFNII